MPLSLSFSLCLDNDYPFHTFSPKHKRETKKHTHAHFKSCPPHYSNSGIYNYKTLQLPHVYNHHPSPSYIILLMMMMTLGHIITQIQCQMTRKRSVLPLPFHYRIIIKVTQATQSMGFATMIRLAGVIPILPR